MTDPRRNLPGVDSLLASKGVQALLQEHPRGRVVDAVRDVLVIVRGKIGKGDSDVIPSGDAEWASRVEALLVARDLPSLRGVINATGVVLHTNLGRAPLSEATRLAMARAGQGYSNLEFDLDAGERGSRYVHCVDLLRELTGAADALVVNNCAAAVVLALNTMAAGREVLVSRGELVEIGGGFRIPDMLSRSGAVLREVGTTNRTRLADYAEAAREGDVAGILKVHRSNFRISGFTEEATIPELAALAGELGVFLFHDLGSGLLADPAQLGLPPEPRAPESLKAGAHAVSVSGDKLLGGPQAGIVLGAADVVEPMRKNPLCRAFRVDKVTLAGLEATLRHYLDPEEVLQAVPALRMLTLPLQGLEARARALGEALGAEEEAPALGGDAAGPRTGDCEALNAEVRVSQGIGVVGGGTSPGVEIPTWTVRIKPPGGSPRTLAAHLRAHDPPIVTRVESEEVVVDLRTVDPDDDATVTHALKEALGAGL